MDEQMAKERRANKDPNADDGIDQVASPGGAQWSANDPRVRKKLQELEAHRDGLEFAFGQVEVQTPNSALGEATSEL